MDSFWFWCLGDIISIQRVTLQPERVFPSTTWARRSTCWACVCTARPGVTGHTLLASWPLVCATAWGDICICSSPWIPRLPGKLQHWPVQRSHRDHCSAEKLQVPLWAAGVKGCASCCRCSCLSPEHGCAANQINPAWKESPACLEKSVCLEQGPKACETCWAWGWKKPHRLVKVEYMSQGFTEFNNIFQ